ncbi:MAG TPA: cardiolipin synthase [Gammaproteobacteria bacterium]|nr:cardiolipin synthase [Gammaproteobacteria bacterium]
MNILSLALIYHILNILAVLLAGFLVATVLQQKRPPSTSLAWILFIVLVPYLAIPLYLAIGSRKLSQSRMLEKEKLFTRPSRPPHSTVRLELDHLLDSLGIPPALGGNQVTLHQHGRQSLDALLKILNDARQQIDVCIFILADDPVGQSVMKQLLLKARQGVRVRLLLDGVGSFLLPRKTLRPLRQAGVEIVRFIPVVHRPLKGRTNLRNHRKLVIADGRHAWSGGRNLAQEYFLDQPDQPAWIDLSFNLKGPAACYYQSLFDADWDFASHGKFPDNLPATDLPPMGDAIVRVLPSGPDVSDDPLQALMLSACFEARERIVIVTPYFVPDSALQEALRLAVGRGVQVDLVLPEHSNHHLADLARSRYLRELHDSGATVHYHPHRMIHAKAMLFDQRLALCGSANFDLRSLYLNFESMALFYSGSEIIWLANWMDSLIQQCRIADIKPPGRIRQLTEGAALLLSFQL